MWIEAYDEKFRVNLRTGKNFDKVLEKVDPLVKVFARDHIEKFRYYTYEELCQEIRILVIKGIRNFDKSKGAKFSTFLHTHLNNKIISLIQRDRKMSNNASYTKQKGLDIEIPIYCMSKFKWDEADDDGDVFSVIPSHASIYSNKVCGDFKRIRFRQSLLSLLERRANDRDKDVITRMYIQEHLIKDIAKDYDVTPWAISAGIKSFGKRCLNELLIPDNDEVEVFPPANSNSIGVLL